VIVDLHAHIIVPEITRGADPADPWRPTVRRERGAQVVEFRGRSIRSAVGEFVVAEQILQEAAACGVDRLVLSPWVSLLPYDLDLAAAVRACRVQNDALAALCAAHPDRVSALGAVPLQDPGAAAAELERLLQAPGVGGVEVAASVGGVWLGDDRLLPFCHWASRKSDCGAPVASQRSGPRMVSTWLACSQSASLSWSISPTAATAACRTCAAANASAASSSGIRLNFCW
jgi:aminocarboxymuconate-semialdehyde decarboxylase